MADTQEEHVNQTALVDETQNPTADENAPNTTDAPEDHRQATPPAEAPEQEDHNVNQQEVSLSQPNSNHFLFLANALRIRLTAATAARGASRLRPAATATKLLRLD